MQLSLAARPPHAQSSAEGPPGRMKRSIVAFLGALLAAFALSTAPALANAGKVLVFTGTAGTLERGQRRRASPRSRRSAPPTTSRSTSPPTRPTSTRRTSPSYRAVVFVNSAGDVLDAAGETALQDYVKNGGGFVGIGETRAARAGRRRVLQHADRPDGRTRIDRRPARRARRTSSSSTACIPATRALPLLDKAQTENWYTWTTNPTGTVHTVARVRVQHAARTARRSPTTRSAASPAATDDDPAAARARRRPGAVTSSRAARSTPSSAADRAPRRRRRHQEAPARRHPVGGGHGPRRLQGDDHLQLHVDAPDAGPTRRTASNAATTARSTKSALADDGRVFYGGRAICSQG